METYMETVSVGDDTAEIAQSCLGLDVAYFLLSLRLLPYGIS